MLLREIWTAFKYGLVGLVNTGISVVLMYLFAGLGLPYGLYTAIAYVVGMIVSFTLNYLVTFRSQGLPVLPRALKFAAVSLTMLGVVQLVQYLLIDRIGLAEPAGVAIGMVVYTGGGYALNRLWVFGGRNA